ncbi:hypothetical protein GMRT_11267 [Giardia muris]|uniref:Uncharacterized protein n=1 Tax=Giardia muris TaxID=5742 RepID=A0A4Z1T4M5_GIAMU|nr:hypothetical protein GMRT_11267 [Giardia muris]|eukprot:TNJ27391.1 hypothetical protein GMRT_11267 [Giardia muris]
MSLIASTGGRVLFSLAKTAVGGEALRSSCAQSCTSCPNSGTCGATVGYGGGLNQDVTFQGSDQRLGEVRINLGRGKSEEVRGRQSIQANAGNMVESNGDDHPMMLRDSGLGSSLAILARPQDQAHTRLSSSSEKFIPSHRRGSVCYNVLVDLGYL